MPKTLDVVVHERQAEEIALDDAREEGRQEILARVAAVTNPMGGGSPIYDPVCVFCGRAGHEGHDSACLWVEATR